MSNNMTYVTLFQIAFTVCWLQSTESQFIGEWDKGTFVSGTWALSDGSQFKGDFGSQVWCSRPVSVSVSVVRHIVIVQSSNS